MRKQRKMIKCLAALATATACTFCFIPTSSAEALTVSQQYIHCNRSHQYLQPRGLVIHDTDCPNGSAQNNHDYFNRTYAGASAHYFVGWDKTIQAIPESEVAWHAGYTANHRFLSIEMCEPRSGNYAQFNKVYWDTVDLAANICKRYGWSTNQVFSHKYCSNTWHQTDHQDPYAFLQKFGKSWDGLMRDIQAKINGGGGSVTTNSTSSNPSSSSNYSDQNYKGSDTNATVQVNSTLNVRETPNGKIIGQLHNGEKVKINYTCSTGDWYSIYYGDKGGFVSKKYVKANGSNNSHKSSTDQVLNGKVIAHIGLNVRDVNGNIIGCLPCGREVTIDTLYSNKNQWSIRYGNHGGLVSKQYIKLN